MSYILYPLFQDHRILEFLGNLCVCGDRPIPSNQSEHTNSFSLSFSVNVCVFVFVECMCESEQYVCMYAHLYFLMIVSCNTKKL